MKTDTKSQKPQDIKSLSINTNVNIEAYRDFSTEYKIKESKNKFPLLKGLNTLFSKKD